MDETVVVVWLIYQPAKPAVPDIEVEMAGAAVSTLTSNDVLAILPAVSWTLIAI
jgi:hypothetical protein